MIDKQLIKSVVEETLRDSGYFPVDVEVSRDNDIRVEIENANGSVDVDFCANLSRTIEAALDRDKEDFSLEVGSAGITSPFKVPMQYVKNIGHEIETIADGRKIKGILKDADQDGFTIAVEEKVKVDGQKKPVIQTRDLRLNYPDVKNTKIILKF